MRSRSRLLSAPIPSATLSIAADRIARGSNFQLAAGWAIETFGAASWQRSLERLGAADLREWDGAPTPIGVYRFGALRRAMLALAHEVERPEEEIVAPLYAHIAGCQLGGAQRLVFRATSPVLIIAKIPALWRGLFTIGSARLEKATRDSATMRFTVPGCLVDWLAPFTLGATTRVVEIAGGGGATVWETDRRALGADTWDLAFTLDWRSELHA